MCLATVSVGSRVRVRSKARISGVTTTLVSQQMCDGQVKDAIDKMSTSWAEIVKDIRRHRPPDKHVRNTLRKVAGIGRKTNTSATMWVSWLESVAGGTRVQQCAKWQASVRGTQLEAA